MKSSILATAKSPDYVPGLQRRKRMKTRSVTTALVGSLALAAFIALAACAPTPTPMPAPTAVPPTVVPTAEAPTAMPATEAPTAAAQISNTGATAAPAASGPVTLQLATNSTLGSFLADSNGRTLYLFTQDTKDTSNCYDKCAQAWPPLLSSGQVTVTGTLDGSLLGSTQRKDGTTQVTFNHWPLYYFASDLSAGDTTGQAVGNVWWVVSGEGNIIRPAAVHIVTVSGVGKYLVDANGFTLYVFTKDSTGNSTCYGKCEAAWPPLLTVGAPTAGDGANATLLGTLTRKDGSVQVTFQGLPLYYFAGDQKAGDTKGQGVGSVWFIVGPRGNVMKTP
jgi:predicted lipoprotein with Yx(FWY)xxD motif